MIKLMERNVNHDKLKLNKKGAGFSLSQLLFLDFVGFEQGDLMGQRISALHFRKN